MLSNPSKMFVHSLSYVATVVIAASGVNSQSPVPTDSGWSEFQCFSDEEINEYRQLFNIHKAKLDINGEFSILADDYSLLAYVPSILQRELLGMEVQLWDFYDEAEIFVDFMTAQNSMTLVFHWGLLEKDVENSHGIHLSLSSQTTWAMQQDAARSLEEQLMSHLGEECDLLLGQWRAFTRDEVIGLMDNASSVVIPPRDDGTMPCSEWYGCMHGDSTWYPPRCANGTNECMVLLQFLPEHDSELNRDLILNYNLSIVIKYMGSPKTHYGQSNFRTFYDGDYRVIFQLRSIDTVSADGYGWRSIVLPAGEEINDNQAMIALASNVLSDWSMGLLEFAKAVGLDQSDVAWIQKEIFSATNKGTENETKDIRMQAVCDWMKTTEGGLKWRSWMLRASLDELSGPLCSTIDDQGLRSLDNRSEESLWTVDWFRPKNEDDSKLQEDVGGAIVDSLGAVFLKRNCISDHEEEQNLALVISAYCLAGCALVLLIVAIVATTVWKEQEIVVSSSIKLTAVLCVGALFALSVVLFLENDIASHCIMRMYVVQIGMTLMFGSLAVKIWRLSVIHENIKLLRTINITEKTQIRRIGIVFLLLIGFLSSLMIIYPTDVRMNIVNGERTTMCEWDGKAETAYGVLLVLEALGLFLVARTAWSIKSVNDVYNEHKWIGSTFLFAAVIVSVYSGIDMLETSDSTIIIQSMMMSVLVMLVISLVMMPRFCIIRQGKEYQPDSFEHDSISFASSLLTKQDLKRMRSLLRKFGYRVVLKGSRGSLTESSASGSGWSQGLSKGMHRLWAKRPRSSTNFSTELAAASDVQISVTR